MTGLSRQHLIPVLAVLIASGCGTPSRPQTPAPLTDAGNGLAGIKAHTESADRAVTAAKPHADTTGKALLAVASAEHGAITVKADQAQQAVEAARTEAAQASTALADAKAETVRITSKTFVKVALWLEWLIVIALWVAGIGIVLRIAALFVTGPVGSVLAVVGSVMFWPGHLTTLADNLWFRKLSKPKVTEGQL
jgi:hypothetical protein